MHLDDSWILFSVHKTLEKNSILYLRLFTPLPVPLRSVHITTCTLIPRFSHLLVFVWFSVVFVGVLEKTVEGEAGALIKAKTLYKSCTNESESADFQDGLFLFITSLVLNWTFLFIVIRSCCFQTTDHKLALRVKINKCNLNNEMRICLSAFSVLCK